MMDLAVAPPEQALYAIRAMKTVALADGALHPQERRMIEAALELFGREETVEDLEAIEPEALASGLTDATAREAFVKRLVVLTTLDGDVTEDELSMVERYAEALDVEERALKNLHQLLDGHIKVMAFDLGRRSFAPGMIKGVWREEGLRGLWAVAKAALGITDAELAGRFEALGKLPEGTMGKALYHQYVDNEFPYPGQKKGPPASLLFHDVGHVLGGFGTEPQDELRVAAFQAGYMSSDPLVMYLMIAMLFQLAVEPAAEIRGVEARRELVDVDTFQAAYDAGRGMKRSLVGWDPWPHMDRPLADVREELGLPREGAP